MENDVLELYRLETSFDADTSCPIHTIFPGECRREYTERWSVVEEIGAGAMGIVRSEKEEITGKRRAVKSLYKPMMKGSVDYRRELLAMGILSKYSHAFVKFLGWYEDTHNLYVAMELFEVGDLGKYLLSKGPRRPESECKVMAFQIFRALEYMHRHGFTHRDLKPENIFVASTDPLHLKIGDFGISKRATVSTGLHTRAYTLHYAAPEVILTSPTTSYSSKVDIWSAGCVLYKVLTGETPFKEPIEIYHFCTRTGDVRVSEPAKVLRKYGVGETGVAFLLRLLKAKPEERPTAAEARAMAWPKGWLDGMGVETEVEATIAMTKKDLLRDLEMTKQSRNDAVKRLKEETERVKALEDTIAKLRMDLKGAQKAEVEARGVITQLQEALQTKESKLQSMMAELTLKKPAPKATVSKDHLAKNMAVGHLRKEPEEQKMAPAATNHAAFQHQESITAPEESALKAHNVSTAMLEKHEAELAPQDNKLDGITALERQLQDLHRQLTTVTKSYSAVARPEEKLKSQVGHVGVEKSEEEEGKEYQEKEGKGYQEGYQFPVEGYKDEHQGEYQGEYQEGYQEGYQGEYQGEYQEWYHDGFQEGYHGEYQDGHQGEYHSGYQGEYHDGYQEEYQRKDESQFGENWDSGAKDPFV